MKIGWYIASGAFLFIGIALVISGEESSAALWGILAVFFVMQGRSVSPGKRLENYMWRIFDEDQNELTAAGGKTDIPSVRKALSVLVPYYRDKGARRVIVTRDAEVIYDAWITDGAISEVVTDVMADDA